MADDTEQSYGTFVVPQSRKCRHALLLLNYQNEFASPGGKLHDKVAQVMEKNDMNNKVHRVLVAARETDVLVIYAPMIMKPTTEVQSDFDTHHYDKQHGLFTEGTWGCEFPEQFVPSESDVVLTGRNNFSAFAGTDLSKILRACGVQELFIAGFLSNVGVTDTAHDAHTKMKNMKVTVLKDGCAANSTQEYINSMSTTLPMFCSIATCDDAEKKILSSSRDPSGWLLKGWSPTQCLPDAVNDWLYTTVIGFLVVSYWRGTWTLLDIWSCGQPADASLTRGDTFCYFIQAMEDHPDGKYANLRHHSAAVTYGLGMGMLFIGVFLMWAGIWMPNLIHDPIDNSVTPGKVTPSLAVARIMVLYILGAAAVCMWRGIWYWADHWIFPYDPAASYWTTSLVGSTVCFVVMSGASILAPPAIFLIDGPGEDPPPLANTMMSSWQALRLPAGTQPPQFPLHVELLDVIASFVFLPFMVVWFWRGTWLLYDLYFWGLDPVPRDLHVSLGWGTLMFVLCFALTCEPTMALLGRKMSNNPILLELLGRFRTWILALGTVSFWRVIWYVWDEFLGGTTTLSAGLSHALSVAALLAAGCLSSINAPASTLGVDAVPHPDCADEPLFSMMPLPFEVLYFMGIARQPVDIESKQEDESEVEMSHKTVGSMKPIDEDKEADYDRQEVPPTGPSKRHLLRVSSVLNNFHTGKDGLHVSYHDLQRPHMMSKQKSAYAMRPGMENKRNRSSFFRNR